MSVTSVGARVGKVKLLNVDDGSTTNCALRDYLKGEVARTIRVARKLGTRLIRGFSFYHPRGTKAADHLDQLLIKFEPLLRRVPQKALSMGWKSSPILLVKPARCSLNSQNESTIRRWF